MYANSPSRNAFRSKSDMGHTEVFPEGTTSSQRPSDATYKEANACCMRNIKQLRCAVVVVAALCIGIIGVLSWHITQTVICQGQVVTPKAQESSQAITEQDHKVVKYLLNRYQQVEYTNLETAKLLESQDAYIRSLQRDLEELKTKHNDLTAEVKPGDCADLSTNNVSVKSGIFTIYPTSNFPKCGLSVYCDMVTQGGGWIVIQRRQDGSGNFDRDWHEYKTGFGELNSEFWLGLDNIHALVSDGKWELLINMRDDGIGEKYAVYKTFSVGPESGGYVLTVGNYSGDAGDSLTFEHNGMKFSTKDNDNDQYEYHCAVVYTGAWWHNKCHSSNLNGVYGSSKSKGPRWETLTGRDPVEFVEMKVKRKM